VIKAATCSSSGHNVGFIWPATNWTSSPPDSCSPSKMLQLCNHIQCCLNDVLGAGRVSFPSGQLSPTLRLLSRLFQLLPVHNKMSATGSNRTFLWSTELENVPRLPSNCLRPAMASIEVFQCSGISRTMKNVLRWFQGPPPQKTMAELTCCDRSCYTELVHYVRKAVGPTTFLGVI
jgi:hypothetical protein